MKKVAFRDKVLVTTPASEGTIVVANTNNQLVELPVARGWGWLPALTLVSAAGLLSISFGYSASRNSAEWAGMLFWAGLLMIFVPTAWRLFSPRASRQERIALVAVLGIALYLVKVLHSPINFTFHDEFIHWRTTIDIVNSQHLFSRENPIIPVSPLYPGMHILTAAIVNLTGLDIFASSLILIGIGRLILMLSLYLLFEEITRSPRVASVGALLYTVNPNFLFFTAQYAYESMSLPLTMLVLFAAAHRARVKDENRLTLNLTVALGLLVVVLTHHLTSYALIGFLALWAMAAFLWGFLTKFLERYAGEITTRQMFAAYWRNITGLWRPVPTNEGNSKRWDHLGSGGAVLLAFVASLGWLVYVATYTVGYLAPVLQGAVLELVRMIAGEATGRQLFKSATGQVAPLWEQLNGFAAVFLILLGLLVGFVQLWRRYQDNALAFALGIVALGYPASLAMRLTVAGWEISNRASEFVFVAVAFLLAIGFIEFWLAHRNSWRWTGLFVAWATLIFVGGMLVGWPPASRMPGPYLVSADTRSVEQQGISAATWARNELGPNQRVGADRINSLLFLSYGEQRMVMGSDKVQVAWVFFAKEWGDDPINLLQRGKFRYLVVDRRMTTGLPMVGIYFESGEPGTQQHKTPLDPALLAKFDKVPNIHRVFDSGDILIYDVGAISGVR